jgi:hypothetical protein
MKTINKEEHKFIRLLILMVAIIIISIPVTIALVI